MSIEVVMRKQLFGFVAVVAMVGAWACSSSSSAPETAVAPIATAEDVVAATPVATTPGESKARNMRFGIVVGGNLVGELEPCG